MALLMLLCFSRALAVVQISVIQIFSRVLGPGDEMDSENKF